MKKNLDISEINLVTYFDITYFASPLALRYIEVPLSLILKKWGGPGPPEPLPLHGP